MHVQSCSVQRSLTAGCYRYLEREFLTGYKNSKIVLLRPTMSFMLAQTADSRTLKVALSVAFLLLWPYLTANRRHCQTLQV